MPAYTYETTSPFFAYGYARFDTDTGGTTQAAVYSADNGAAFPSSLVPVASGQLPRVVGDLATVYVRHVDANGVVVSARVLKIKGQPLEAFGGPTGGSVTKAAVVATGLSASDIGAADLATATKLNALAILLPSGDTTGAADYTAITSALSTNSQVLLAGGLFYVNDSIGMPSNSTLRLREAELIRVASGSINQCNVITTDQVKALGNAGGAIATPNTNVRIIGDGKSRIYVQNPAGVTRANTRLWNYIGILMVRVDGLVIEGVEVGPTQAFGVCLQGVTKARVRRVRLSQDATTNNQDGVDVGPGCQDVVIEQITGASGDDVFSLFGHNTAASMHPAVNATNLTGTAADILDIAYRNCSVYPGINFFRFNCGDGRAVHRITVENVASTKNLVGGYNAFIQIGEVQYTTTPATVQNFSGIMVRNVRPGMRLLNLDQNVAGVHISGVSYEGNQSPQIIGKSSVGSNLSTAVTCQDITVENLTMGDPASAVTVSACVILPVNTVTRMTLRNWSVNRIKGLLDNGATITGLKIRNVEIGVLGQPTGGVGWLVNSTVAETGSMDGVTVDTYAGVFSGLYVGSAVVKLKLGPNMPVVTSQDTAITTASATTKGSTITVDNTKQPDGGGGTTAATWIANGTTWIKQTDLGAMVGR